MQADLTAAYEDVEEVSDGPLVSDNGNNLCRLTRTTTVERRPWWLPGKEENRMPRPMKPASAGGLHETCAQNLWAVIAVTHCVGQPIYGDYLCRLYGWGSECIN
eukprot:CAMPEP_0183361282 /NCGR_PEP_ID=MMETSP0164_2-20130417/58803_1 /TAXON_ID=221442 /ORGANISM="Coccolithus pelagicus ssp braarudi, Strain PLY182g" /LENGTH=103 /DNA_ID=CAMNT_0025535827 /DNA_START=52 /DNA_END=360 /DNA_ORIENTATION=+